jgi:hypothetical protein
LGTPAFFVSQLCDHGKSSWDRSPRARPFSRKAKPFFVVVRKTFITAETFRLSPAPADPNLSGPGSFHNFLGVFMSQQKSESSRLLVLLALALSVCMLLPALFANVG